MSIRDDIRALCAEHDRFMAEQASEPIRNPTVSETDERRGLVYKRFDPPPEPAGNGGDEPSDDEDTIQLFGDWRDKALTDALAEVIVELRREWRQEREAELVKRDRKIGELEGELREIRGMLGATLTLLGQQKPKLWTPGNGT
jgi:hypothetical protein